MQADTASMPEKVDVHEIASAMRRDWSAIAKRARKQFWPFEEVSVRGGRKKLYLLKGLPAEVQAAVALRRVPKASSVGRVRHDKSTREQAIRAAWLRFESADAKQRAKAERRVAALLAVNSLTESGLSIGKAREIVAKQLMAEQHKSNRKGGVSQASLIRWANDVVGVPQADWAPILMPAYTGRTSVAEIPAQCWDWYAGHYLTRARPTHSETYRRLQEMADAQGWVIPCARTFERRMEREVHRVAQVIHRDGPAAAARLIPTMQRDALSFGVGEAVNGDGLKFDRIWVRFEDGEVINTATAWFWQDIHSRRILAWRLAKTENTDVFRLATYDLTGECAPTFVLVDNTRVAANKLMTAGATGRHRFKTDPEEGIGLLRMLGMEPHFTNPDQDTGNPGAKPIERAFGVGGIHELVATNPRIIELGGFSKATAIDVAVLREVIAQEVVRFNARPNRRTQACRGLLSFDQAWEAGLTQRPPTVLSEAQRKLLLMSREVVTADKRTGEIRIEAGRGPFGQNAYWSEPLAQLAGRKLAVHFDPDNLAAGIHVYGLDARYLCAAEHRPRQAFNSTDAGREFGKLKRRVSKANKEIAANETRMTKLQRSALYAAATANNPAPAPTAPEQTVVTGRFRRVANPERDAQRATGTDGMPAEVVDLHGARDSGDATPRERNLDVYLEQLQRRQLAERMWTPPQGDD